MTVPQPSFRDVLSLYESSMRAEFIRLLKSHFGDNWWERGVLDALRDPQVDNLRRQTALRKPDARLEDLLELSHFVAIFRFHHSQVFSGKFPDYQRADFLLRKIRNTRNRWAHLETLSNADIEQCILHMVEVLSEAGLSVASDLRQMHRQLMLTYDSNTQEQSINPDHDTEYMTKPEASPQSSSQTFPGKPTPIGGVMDIGYGLENESLSDVPEEEAEKIADIASWRKFLTQRVEVEPFTDDQGRDRRKLSVTIVNLASTRPNEPVMRFMNVSLSIANLNGSSRENISVGNLEPSQSVSREFEIDPEQLLSVEFSVEATLDYKAYFRTKEVIGVPPAEIKDIALSYLRDLSRLNLGQILGECDKILESLTPDTTLAEVRRIKHSLAQIVERTHENRDQLQSLFTKYRLHKGTPFGDHVVRGVQLLQTLRDAIASLDDAIASVEPDDMTDAVIGIKQLATEAIRFENSTKRIAESFGLDEKHTNAG